MYAKCPYFVVLYIQSVHFAYKAVLILHPGTCAQAGGAPIHNASVCAAAATTLGLTHTSGPEKGTPHTSPAAILPHSSEGPHTPEGCYWMVGYDVANFVELWLSVGQANTGNGYWTDGVHLGEQARRSCPPKGAVWKLQACSFKIEC